MARSVGWKFVTNILGHPVSPIFKGQAVLRIHSRAVQEERMFILDFSSWTAWTA
jgi:hypothetical protein